MFKQKPESKNKPYSLIVGCGRLGVNITNVLSDTGEEVSILDISKDSFRKLSPSFSGFAIQSSGTDFSVLEEANIQNATSVLAVTDNDNININIRVSQIAKEMHGKKVIARLYDTERNYVYNELEIKTIWPSHLSAHEIDRILCSCNG